MDNIYIFGFLLATAAASVVYFSLTSKSKKSKEEPLPPSPYQVSALFIYPIKSCYGIQVNAAEIGKYGFQYDRQWMLIDANSNFMSQRTKPPMGLIKPTLDFEKGVMHVDAPGMKRLTRKYLNKATLHDQRFGAGIGTAVFASTASQSITYHDFLIFKIPLKYPKVTELFEVTVWGEKMAGLDEGEAAAQWFSKFLDTPDVRLVRIAEDHSRKVEAEFAKPGAYNVCSYVDAFPYLITSETSLQALKAAVDSECGDHPITMRRFRPNIVISGLSAWDEVFIDQAQIGRSEFYLNKPCGRCKLTTVIPEKGEFGGNQPLEFIKKERRAVFGMNAVHGLQALGDQIKVGDPFYIKTRRTVEIELT